MPDDINPNPEHLVPVSTPCVQFSKYQQACMDWIQSAVAACVEQCALLIDAKAGSGKTFTGIHMLGYIPRHLRIIFLAFNKLIATTLQQRAPAHCACSTLNAFGHRILMRELRGARLDPDRTISACSELKIKKTWWGSIKKMIGLRKACPSWTVEHLLEVHDFDITDEQWFAAMEQVWAVVGGTGPTFDFDDQIYLPVSCDMPIDRLDWVFVDEAQDLNESQLLMVQKIADRIVAIGDPNQAIYAFRGALPTAMQDMKVALNAATLPLSICYRCPQAVVRYAQQWVPELEWAPGAPEGEVRQAARADLLKLTQPGDWVSCRKTAPLITGALEHIVAGKKACVKGKEIGKDLVALIDKVASSDGMLAPDFQAALLEYYQRECARLNAANRFAAVDALGERYDSVVAVANGARTVGDMKMKIASTFSDTDSPGVTFLTIHKSKGGEVGTQYVIPESVKPRSELQAQQERNLLYVQATRALKALVLLKGE